MVKQMDIGDEDYGSRIEIEPEWLSQLEDKTIRVGEHLIYSLGSLVSTFDQFKNATVTLGLGSKTRDIVTYDSKLNAIVINGDNVMPINLGEWQVYVLLTFDHEGLQKFDFEGSFNLKIEEDPV